MKRSIKPRKVGFVPWLIGLAVVGGSLIGIFSLGRSSWLRQVPGLHIGTTEWNGYQSLFDRHPAADPSGSIAIVRFGASSEVNECLEEQRGGAWRTRWFEGERYGDSVEVRNLLDRQGWAVRFKSNALYKEQRHLLLTAATRESTTAKELEVLANELGLITPTLSLARVLSCGTELPIQVQQEWPDEAFLERRGIRGSTLVRMSFDPDRPEDQFPVIKADSAERAKLRGILERAFDEASRGNTDLLASLVDERAAAAWLLMAWIDGRDIRHEQVTFVYNWSNGRFSPIYQVPAITREASTGPVLYNLLTPLLERPSFKMRFEKLQVELATKWPELQRRTAATRALWASVLGGLPQQAITLSHLANSNAAARLSSRHVMGLGHATFVHGMTLPPAAAVAVEDTVGLSALAKRLELILQGDSIIFPRGKYMINEDLIFPAGRAVLMQQGARLFMAPGRSILVKGDLYIRGTLRNPVFIRPQEDAQPFGAIAVLGGSSQQCAISGLYVSGGAGAKLAGTKCGGMVTVQGAARTIITTSVLQENKADAALVVDGGELDIRELRCEDASRTFVQLDHVRGVLRELVMVGAKVNATTGLHIGTGTLALFGGTFTNLKKDAILVDGAAQVLVRNTRLSQNATAIRSDGRAEVHVEGCTIEGNEVAFATGTANRGDRLLLYSNKLTGNKVDRNGTTGFKELPVLDAATVSLFGVAAHEAKAESSTGRRTRGSRNQ